MIKALIYDVDGVVFRSLDEEGKYLWGKNAACDLGLRSHHFKQIYSPAWNDVARGKVSTISHLAEVFKGEDFAALRLSPQAYIDYWLSHDAFINERLLADIACSSVPCYLGTNQERHRTRHIKQLVGHAFVGIFASYELGFIKPESGFYAAIEQNLGLEPQELMLIDDTPANIEAAQKRGWQGVLYKIN